MNFVEQFYNWLEGHPVKRQIISIATIALFPIFLVCVVETTHLQNFSAFCNFATASTGVLLYDVAFVFLIFAALVLLVRHVWIAALAESFVLYALSLVEYFKFNANGTHFNLADLVMAGKISDIARFTSLDISAVMVLKLVLIAAFVLWTACLKLKLRLPKRMAIPAGATVFAMLCVTLSVPSLYKAVYGYCGIDYRQAYGPYSADESFRNNLQIAFLSKDISMEVAQNLSKPPNYSRQSVQELLPNPQPQQKENFEQPDIVLIMSEAYTDFRKFPGIPIPENTYRNFDRLSQDGQRGTALVPTFGGYTCKTEFELLFGLPVKGINNAEIPHQLFVNGIPRPTFPAYLQTLGYTTNFIHPFSASFYNRNKAYRSYGFDQLCFEDDMTVTQTRLENYIDDCTLVRQIEATLEAPGEKASFIYAISMQNHGPYKSEAQYAVRDARLTEEEQGELGRYLYGVSQTDKALGELTDYLSKRTRPTVLLFVGDHYPYLGKQAGMYKKFADNQKETDLYMQPYLLWSNYKNNFEVPSHAVSAFYLPYVLAQNIQLPQNAFFAKMTQLMESEPQFTFDLGDGTPEARTLMQLTYDRTEGEDYSTGESRPLTRLSALRRMLFTK